jgi:hypothetical protein
MKTNTKKTSPKVAVSKTNDKEAPKKFSKTWQAVLSLQGTGKILDMRAVLK